MHIRATRITSIVVALDTALHGIATLFQGFLVAAKFGVSPSVDAYQLASMLPILEVSVVSSGSIIAVVVPQYTKGRDLAESNELRWTSSRVRA